jgi:hypothetical protein
MASTSRSGATNKKQAAARAKAHDRRLLARAEQETAEGPKELTPAEKETVEGKVARNYLNGLMVALEKAAPKPQPIAMPAATGERGAMLAAELRELSESLGLALGDIIEAHVEEDVSAFTEALRRVNSARVVLQGEAAKLEAVQP